MCMQCMAGAMTAVAGATGARSVLAHRIRQRFGPRALHRFTAVLLAGALAASALIVSGSNPASATSTAKHAAPPAHAVQATR